MCLFSEVSGSRGCGWVCSVAGWLAASRDGLTKSCMISHELNDGTGDLQGVIREWPLAAVRRARR